MENFHLYTGNDLALLAETMLDTLAVPPKAIFTPERFIVQSKGMEFWLSQHIARSRGICANVVFEYPEAFLQSLYRTLHTDVPRESGWDRGTLAWIIMRVLPTLLDDAAFAVVRAYLRSNGTGTIDQERLYQLAVRIADLFDQYMVFRADRVLGWELDAKEEDPDAQWQKALWTAIVRDPQGGPLHRARMQQTLIRKLQQPMAAAAGLPERLTVFGISYLPQYYIEVLAALSLYVEINYFAINPSAAYWSDVATPREAKKLAAQGADIDVGNTLLASLGVQGRDFFEMLLERNFSPDESAFAEPSRDTLLHRMQHDIFSYAETAHAAEGDEDGEIAAADDSVTIHSCHSPMREMEVLHDHILGVLERDAALEPGDIIVMAPAIEEYAPYIEAVFDSVEKNRIPYTIADRSVRNEQKIADAFMTLLRFHRTRFAASAVLELLECENIAGRFGLSLAELDTVKVWVRQCRIRWGLDADAIAKQYGVPVDNVNTWRYGLSRMLLGYAYPSQNGDRMFGGIMPFDNIEGGDAETFGKLLSFFTQLEHLDAILPGSHPLAEWGTILQRTAEEFFLMTYEESCALTPAIGELTLVQERSGFSTPVEIAVVLDVLGASFDSEGASQRFLRGGVTFCSLLPMRSIPAHMICLVGMNNGAFPRQQQKLGFNEMTKHPRRGDRSRRNDDRYMFLEALISARSHFYISYCGQSTRDNAHLPPSVVVSELLDYIENNFTRADGSVAPADNGTGSRTQPAVCVVEHKLQAFNPAYFRGLTPLSSYSKKYARAASALLHGADEAKPFVDGPLAPSAAVETVVDVSDFIRFFSHPAEQFLKQRLHVYFDDGEEAIEDDELFALDNLEAYSLKQRLLDAELRTGDARGEYERIAASGELPHGAPGRMLFESLCADVEHFGRSVALQMRGAKRADAEIDITVSGLRITGTIGNMYAEALLFYRMASMKAKDYLIAWISHLLVQASGRPDYPRVTLCCAYTTAKLTMEEFHAVPDPLSMLEALALLYIEGLQKPLPFFPEASKKYVDELRAGKADEEAMETARLVWGKESFSGTQAESDDPYIAQCFDGTDPFTPEFAELALRMYTPLLDACGVSEGGGE